MHCFLVFLSRSSLPISYCFLLACSCVLYNFISKYVYTTFVSRKSAPWVFIRMYVHSTYTHMNVRLRECRPLMWMIRKMIALYYFVTVGGAAAATVTALPLLILSILILVGIGNVFIFFSLVHTPWCIRTSDNFCIVFKCSFLCSSNDYQFHLHWIAMHTYGLFIFLCVYIQSAKRRYCRHHHRYWC